MDIGINCEFSHGIKCSLLLFPNDSLRIKVDEQISFSGKNKAGLDYLNSTQKKITGSYMASTEDVLMKYIKQEITFNTAMSEVSKNIIQPTTENIRKELSISSTSDRFIKTLQKNTQIEFNSYLVLLLRSILEVESYRKTALKDSIEITKRIDSIFKTIPLKKEVLKYNEHNYAAQNLLFYNGEECPPNSNGSFLGYCGNILYAPIDMQPILLGEACIRQLKRKKGSIDLMKTQTFLKKKFPDNEYTSIVTEKLKEEENNVEDFNHQYIKKDISALSQLRDVDSLANKYLFIDIWASWCMPCRKEFAHKEQLHKLLNSYPNSAIVYISIDNKNLEANWKQCIQNYMLNGSHLRASNSLLEDIQQQVYGTEDFLIPRYILLSPDGKIIHKNLPRPSNYQKLKKVLENMIK